MDYKCQANWFGRTPLHLSREGVTNRKEASLGLVWANQLNARIMLSRTSRKRPVPDIESCSGPLGNPNVAKRQRLNTPAPPETKFSESESATIITNPHLHPQPTIRRHQPLDSFLCHPRLWGSRSPGRPLTATTPTPAYPAKYETFPRPMIAQANPPNRSSTIIKEELTDEEWALYFPEVFQPGIHGAADELDWDLDFDEDAFGRGADLKSEMGDPPDLGNRGEESLQEGPLEKMGTP
ncbi:hypothetical protein BS47DRAFT_1482159 [Hydnum rufescens UP504]|uniref:Uncharacterized protein n=1 Tax=Hydnum rufescens UP504 TaxID=1448309 RepID=A0A9P6BAB2_9AGAM|nr:hypothetical protein BS47DRAFT_1482159 [Hydnum rufescens UP504]